MHGGARPTADLEVCEGFPQRERPPPSILLVCVRGLPTCSGLDRRQWSGGGVGAALPEAKVSWSVPGNAATAVFELDVAVVEFAGDPGGLEQGEGAPGRRTRYPSPREPGESTDRKRIEAPFDWIKTIAGGRSCANIGRTRNRAWFKVTAAVYNLIRIIALDTRLA